MHKMTIRIPGPLLDELRELARQRRQPMSQIVRKILDSHIATEQFHALRREMVPFAEAQGYLTDKDVFA